MNQAESETLKDLISMLSWELEEFGFGTEEEQKQDIVKDIYLIHLGEPYTETNSFYTKLIFDGHLERINKTTLAQAKFIKVCKQILRSVV